MYTSNYLPGYFDNMKFQYNFNGEMGRFNVPDKQVLLDQSNIPMTLIHFLIF
jgi:hypothetical protein